MSRIAWLLVTLLPVGACTLDVERALAPGELRGVVEGERDGDGRRVGLEGAKVQVVGTPFVVRTDASGRFVVRRLPGGNHEVTIARDANTDGKDDSLLRLRDIAMPKLAAGARNAYDVGRTLLEPSGAISGRITNASGPVSVGVRGRPGVLVPTTSDGRFEFPYLAKGTVELLALVPGPDGAESVSLGSVDVVPRQTKSVSFELAAPTAQAIVSGRFEFDDGLEPSFDLLAAELIGAAQTWPVTIDPQAGTFSEAVPPGVYTLWLKPQGGVAAHYVPNIAVFGDVQVRPVFVFDTTQGFDLDQDGIEDAADDDVDGDGLANESEAAACVRDPWGQRDTDADGFCDTVDPDADADGLPVGLDNCPRVANVDQLDADGDGAGDACDNCRLVANPGQEGPNGEETGDACASGEPVGEDPWNIVERAPFARQGAGLAWDGTRSLLWVFGGTGVAGGLGAVDLWTLDTNTGAWSPIVAPNGPYDLQQPAVFVDESRDRIVVAGAVNAGGAGLRPDVWVLPRTPVPGWRWLRAAPGNGELVPGWVTERGMLATYDEAAGRVSYVDLRSAGEGGNGAVYTLDLPLDVDGADLQWAVRTTTAGQGGLPTGLDGALFTRADGTLLAVGSDGASTSVYTLGADSVWTFIDTSAGQTPGARSDAAYVFDDATAMVHLVGGLGAAGPDDTGWTLTLAAATWEPFSPQALLGRVRHDAGAVWASSRILLFGGRDDTRVFGEVLGVDPLTDSFSVVVPEVASPSARWDAALAWDRTNGRALLYGGEESGGAYPGDLWGLSFGPGDAVWSVVSPFDQLGGPQARSEAAIAWAPALSSVLLHGGRFDPEGAEPATDTWRYDTRENTWTQLFPGGDGPATFVDSSAVWDDAAKRLYVFPREGSTVFALDFTNEAEPAWVRLSPTPAKELANAGVTSSDTFGIVAFFGTDSSAALHRFVADGTPRWELVAGSDTNAPPQRTRAYVAAEPAGKTLLVAGGTEDGGFSWPDLAWEFSLSTGSWRMLCVMHPGLALRQDAAVVGTSAGYLFVGDSSAPRASAVLRSEAVPTCF